MKPTVLITGVAKRLGLAMAEHFLKKDYRVVGTYRTRRPSIDALEAQGTELFCCDLQQQDQVQELCTFIANTTSSLNAIIHNASDWIAEKNTDDTWSCFERMMTVHAKAPYAINLNLEPLLADGANIIHISDYVAATGSAKHIAYAASKAAIENLTYSFAKKLAPRCSVNAIAPALILFNEGDSDDYKTKALTKALLPREGGCEEFLNAVDYLMASDYITGRVLPLDGGRHLK